MSEVSGLLSQTPQNRISEVPGLNAEGHQSRIIYSTISAEEVKRVALRHYSLPNSLTCALYKRGFNDVYRLSSFERQFALRISPVNGRTPSALMDELTVVNHLHSEGIDVARPIPRADGSLITDIMAPEGLRKAVVFGWVNGSTPLYNSELHARQFGRAMARVHAALDNISLNSAPPRIKVSYLPRMSLDAIRTGIAPHPELLVELTELAHRLEARLNLALKSLRDWGLCHGDLANYNALVDGDRCIVFDFEYCGWGCRLFDLASYRLDARLEGYEAQAWKPFIEEYLAVRPEAESSLEYVGLFMCLRRLWIAARHAERLMERGIASLPERFYETLVPFCEEIESEI